jgi:hypothetical protein
MVDINRRTMLRTAAAGIAGLAVTGGTAAAAPAGGSKAADSEDCLPPLGPVRVTPSDIRYQDLVHRGNNIRYIARPGSSTEPVDADYHVWFPTADSRLRIDGLPAWSEVSTRPTEFREFAGGHFYLTQTEPAIQALRELVERYAAAG